MKKSYEVWKKVAEKIGAFQVNVVFSLLYFLLFIPIGFFSSMFQDFLGKKGLPSWEKVPDNASNLDELGKQ